MDVIYEDEFLIVVDKPAGLPVLPEGWQKDAPYLVRLLEEQHPKIWVVHRLDKATSGVMLFALNAEVHRHLSLQFESHRVEKRYHAILHGAPAWVEKTTRYPLRVNVGHKHRTVVDDHKGVRAETHFKVLECHPQHALVEAMPVTGKTHQIRVHAYALGYPVLGDELYGTLKTDWIDRPALHSHSLKFHHPSTDETLIFQAPYPPDFLAALKRIRV
ncbi:MAG: RluA family pseudouridine synthase [Chloroflexi bacterium]|nr:RluA family pseudouridine synthase [Chloroflexota bacterium]